VRQSRLERKRAAGGSVWRSVVCASPAYAQPRFCASPAVPPAHTQTQGAFPGGVVQGLLAAGCWPRCPFARFAFLRSPKTAMTVTVAGVVWSNWHWHWHWHWHWQLGSLAVARAPFPLALRGPPPGISGLADEWLPSSADTLASRTTHHRALSQLEGATWRASHPPHVAPQPERPFDRTGRTPAHDGRCAPMW